jgi:hypothetical protein
MPARDRHGNVYGPRLSGTRKPAYQWYVGKREDIVVLCEALLPWMGERRSDRLREMLQFAADVFGDVLEGV